MFIEGAVCSVVANDTIIFVKGAVRSSTGADNGLKCLRRHKIHTMVADNATLSIEVAAYGCRCLRQYKNLQHQYNRPMAQSSPSRAQSAPERVPPTAGDRKRL
mmetsp:Transcript_7354/g.14728  ORF Transcript_7354/g.14728 Transcript_7354/m.14728 type:complete len:103 (-) Transcript_7354:267-575(-)